MSNHEVRYTRWDLKRRLNFEYQFHVQSNQFIRIPDSSIYSATDISVSFNINVVSGSGIIFKKGNQNLETSDLGIDADYNYHVVHNDDSYVNSEFVATGPSINWATAADIYFGIYDDTNTCQYHISNICFFDKILTQTEIKGLYINGGSVPDNLHANVIAYYPLTLTSIEDPYIFDAVEQYNYAKGTALESNHAELITSQFLLHTAGNKMPYIDLQPANTGTMTDWNSGEFLANIGTYRWPTDYPDTLDLTFNDKYAYNEDVTLNIVYEDTDNVAVLMYFYYFPNRNTVVDLSHLSNLRVLTFYVSGGANEIIFPVTDNSETRGIYLYGTNTAGTLDLRQFNGLTGVNTRESNYFNAATRITEILFPQNNTNIITNLNLYGANLTGTLDLSDIYIGVTTNISYTIFYQINIDKFIAPKDALSASMTTFKLQITTITSLNISHFTYLTGTVYLNSNLYADEIVLPVNSQSTSNLTLYLGASMKIKRFDLSGITNLYVLHVHYCLALEEIIFASTSNIISTIYCYYTALTDLDFSALSGITYFQGYNSVKLKSLKLPNDSRVFYANCYGTSLTGTLDLSGKDTYYTQNWYTNPLLTNILFGGTDLAKGQYVKLQIYSCNLTGNLDLSEIRRLGYINAYANPNLTSITMSSYFEYQSFINDVRYCNLTGDFDWSMCSVYPYSLYVSHNTKLTSVTFPTITPTNVMHHFKAENCDLTGTLDLSYLVDTLGNTGTGGLIYLENNTQLENVSLPTSYNNILAFEAINCNLKSITLDGANELLKGNNYEIKINYNPLTAAQIQTFLDEIAPKIATGYTGRDVKVYNPLLTQGEIDTIKLSSSYSTIKSKAVAIDLDGYT